MLLASPQRRWVIPVAITVVWLATPWVVAKVVEANQRAGVYDPSADSIMIPIATAVAWCIVGAPYFAVLSLAALWRYVPGVPVWRFSFTWSHVLAIVLVLPGIAMCLLHVLYWLSSEHILIVAMYSLVILWLIWVRPMIGVKHGLAKSDS